MLYQIAAESVLVVHLCFGLFVLFGGFAVVRHPRLGLVHAPMALWGAVVNLANWICPLTPLENRLRRLAGETGYEGAFIEQYLLPVVYSGDVTGRSTFFAGMFVAIWTTALYAWILYRWRSRRPVAAGVRTAR